MKKRMFTLAILAFFVLSLLVGCIQAEQKRTPSDTKPEEVRIAAMKGPTAIGLVKAVEDNKNNEEVSYDLQIYGSSDNIVTGLQKGEIDIACVPCNLASVLYHNGNQSIQIAAVNTLGVLYVVENGNTVHSLADLSGKTVYSTGKGTTPEYSLNHLLEKNGINDVTVEFRSESAEIATILASDTPIVAVLPQPYVTTAQMQNEKLRVAVSLSEEWDKLNDGSSLVTGVVVVRKEFAQKYASFLDQFLEEYRNSAAYANSHVEDTAKLVESYGIFPAKVAEKAIPQCNITFMSGADMKASVSGYLQVLYDSNPKSIGGSLPDDAFYYMPFSK